MKVGGSGMKVSGSDEVAVETNQFTQVFTLS